MPYKTRPYLFWGIPSRFWRSYEIDNDKTLHIRGLFGNPSDVPLGEVSLTVEQGKYLAKLFRKTLDLGNVHIKGSAGEFICDRVRGVKAFKEALNGQHKDVQPPPKPSSETALEKDLNGTTTPSADASQPKQPSPILVTELSSSQTKRSRALFKEAVTACSPRDSDEAVARPSSNGTWEVVSQWDASHAKPRHGEERYIEPTLIAWSPDGSELVTACNGRTFTRWSVDGKRIGGNGAFSYSPAMRFSWSPDGRFVLLEGTTGRNRYWTIQGQGGEVLWQVVPDGNLDFSHNVPSGLERTEYRTPWRPWRAQLLVSKGESCLDLLSVSETIDSPAASLDFSGLAERSRHILRYHWHPSGDFLAVTVCNPGNERATSHVLITYFERGEIVASVSASATGMGWSPDGRLFLYSRWNAPNSDISKREAEVWDSGSWTCRKLTEDEHNLVWVRRLHNNDLVHDYETLNADGSMVLRYGKLLDSKAWGQQVETASDREVIQELPHYEHAAWSPTDPNCFATVGGPDDLSRMVCIWRLVRAAE